MGPSLFVELAEDLSKLAPALIQMVRAHQSIRSRRHGPQHRRRQPRRGQSTHTLDHR